MPRFAGPFVRVLAKFMSVSPPHPTPFLADGPLTAGISAFLYVINGCLLYYELCTI